MIPEPARLEPSTEAHDPLAADYTQPTHALLHALQSGQIRVGTRTYPLRGATDDSFVRLGTIDLQLQFESQDLSTLTSVPAHMRHLRILATQDGFYEEDTDQLTGTFDVQAEVFFPEAYACSALCGLLSLPAHRERASAVGIPAGLLVLE